MSKLEPKIAAYWDFENIHAAAVNAEHGEGAYAQLHGEQPRILNLDAIVSYMRSIGNIVVHRAYGNWHNLACYCRYLQRHSIDLVQMFPRAGQVKNGADIRMALDAMDDATRYPYITHVAIIGGDTDFVPLARKLRQAGKTVVGIALRESTNACWRQACKFMPYRSVLKAWKRKAKKNGEGSPRHQSRSETKPSGPDDDAYHAGRAA